MTHKTLIGLTLASAIGWGLWWVPIRAAHALGLAELWASALPICVAALGASLLLAWRRLNPLALPRVTITGAALFGSALALYGVALGFTDVVRAALFFYLAPIWALLIETFWLRLRLSWHGPLAAALCLLGLLSLFQFQFSMQILNSGDLMALASGIGFSLASTCLFVGSKQSQTPYSLMQITGLMLICSALMSVGLLWGFQTPLGPVTHPAWVSLIIVANGLLLLAPICFVMLMGAERLPPATLALLYTGEIATAVVTAGLFLPSEPFGWFEALGAGLTAGAGLIQATKGAPASQAVI